MADHGLARHDLVWLSASAVKAAQPWGPCCAADPEARALLAGWVGAGNPLIVSRQDAACTDGQVRLGLALPPAQGKRRLAFTVPLGHIIRRTPALALTTATADALPPAWRPTVLMLLGSPAIRAARPRLFGSAAMQIVTGEPCIGPGSDLDLLLEPGDWPAALAACRALVLFDDPGHRPRVDGEIRNADGDAVAWREFATDAPRLLVKGVHEVRLLERERWAAGFARAVGIAA